MHAGTSVRLRTLSPVAPPPQASYCTARIVAGMLAVFMGSAATAIQPAGNSSSGESEGDNWTTVAPARVSALHCRVRFWVIGLLCVSRGVAGGIYKRERFDLCGGPSSCCMLALGTCVANLTARRTRVKHSARDPFFSVGQLFRLLDAFNHALFSSLKIFKILCHTESLSVLPLS